MGLNYWLNPVGYVLAQIDKWKPRKCNNEQDFKLSLFRNLEKGLQGREVIKEYATGRVRGDIVIDKKILIEVKKSLDSTGKLQRLLGQIEIYENDWKGNLILVLCGKHDTNLLAQVRKAVEKRDRGLLPISEPWLYLRTK